MSSLFNCSMAWFLPAFISASMCVLPFKELGIVPSYVALHPSLDRDYLDKCDSPGKQTTKPLSPLLTVYKNWTQGSFVWIYSSRKNEWPICLRWPSLWALPLFIRRERPVRPYCKCACQKANSPWIHKCYAFLLLKEIYKDKSRLCCHKIVNPIYWVYTCAHARIHTYTHTHMQAGTHKHTKAHVTMPNWDFKETCREPLSPHQQSWDLNSDVSEPEFPLLPIALSRLNTPFL